MLPAALTLHNYRSFAGPQRLEIRPITLLYGENNAGKSALIRSLALLADSAGADGLDALELGERLAPLELDFDSLRWKGRAETDEHTVGMDLHWPPGSGLATARLALSEWPDWRRLLVQRMTLVDDAGVETSYEWLPRRNDRRARALSYRRRAGEADPRVVTLEFYGLIPHATEADQLIELLNERLRLLAFEVVWLQSLRPAPARVTRRAGTAEWTLDPRGRNAPLLLADEPELRAEVSAWYREQLGLELRVDDPRARELRVALRNTRAARFDIDLIDTGEGLSQVLPVLTALAMAKLRGAGEGPRIVAVEEPEAHLHPNLQLALARRVCEVAARSGARVLLETHSRQFLLAVQRAILSEAIDEREVILYWVRQREDGSSVAEPVELTALARLDGAWPADAFEDDLDVEAEIQDMRDAKESA